MNTPTDTQLKQLLAKMLREAILEATAELTKERDDWLANAKALQAQVNGWEPERAALKAENERLKQQLDAIEIRRNNAASSLYQVPALIGYIIKVSAERDQLQAKVRELEAELNN